jgi:flagellar motor switch protein FliN
MAQETSDEEPGDSGREAMRNRQDSDREAASRHEDHYHFPESDEEAAILQFQQITGESISGTKNVDRFSDVPLRVAIELGRVNMTIGQILELREGAIVETRKLSGQPMEIMVNERLFGRGEVVVVGDNLAIRITDLKKPDLT